MTRHDPIARMRHMLDHAVEAAETLGDKTVETVKNDRLLQLALIRLVEVVGEAASKVPDDARRQYPDIPWREASCIRNLLIHGYDIVRYDILCNTIRQHFPDLIERLSEALSRDASAGADEK